MYDFDGYAADFTQLEGSVTPDTRLRDIDNMLPYLGGYSAFDENNKTALQTLYNVISTLNEFRDEGTGDFKYGKIKKFLKSHVEADTFEIIKYQAASDKILNNANKSATSSVFIQGIEQEHFEMLNNGFHYLISLGPQNAIIMSPTNIKLPFLASKEKNSECSYVKKHKGMFLYKIPKAYIYKPTFLALVVSKTRLMNYYMGSAFIQADGSVLYMYIINRKRVVGDDLSSANRVPLAYYISITDAVKGFAEWKLYLMNLGWIFNDADITFADLTDKYVALRPLKVDELAE